MNEVVGKNENGNPKRIYAYGPTLKEAKEALRIKLDAHNRMGYQNIQSKMTINELYDYWLKNEFYTIIMNVTNLLGENMLKERITINSITGSTAGQ